MTLLSQLVASNALAISRSPDFDHFQSIERLGDARSIPLECRGFDAAFAAVRLKSCTIYLQRTFPRILQAQFCATGAVVGFAMDDAYQATLNGMEVRVPAMLLARGRAPCEVVEPRANQIVYVNFEEVEDRGWPGERDQARLIAAEPVKFEALRAVTRDVLALASHSPETLTRPGMIESVEESLLNAVDHALHSAPLAHEQRAHLGHYLALVRRFDEFLAANAGRTLYSADMARQLGVSVRTLHNALVAIRGMSMHRYTRLRRLWNVRQQLVQGRTESIKAAALVNGFWHLGEFASLYREMFGETPQQTLAVARGQSGGR